MRKRPDRFWLPGIPDFPIPQVFWVLDLMCWDMTISPLIYIYTEAEYLNEYLGCGDLSALRETDWLSFSEHKLLALTAGKFFQDDLKMADRLSNLNFYPESVRLYLIASNWSLAAEEQAFVRRCADVGDETGSMLACARIAERLMRLAFLYCRRYAPYSKWFGTAFARLPIDPEIKERIRLSLAAPDIETREEHLGRGCETKTARNRFRGNAADWFLIGSGKFYGADGTVTASEKHRGFL